MAAASSKTPKRKIELSFQIFKEGRSYVAYSPALELSTFGKTDREAKSNFVEAVELFFDELKESGNLDRVLTDLGWRKIKKEWAPPAVESIKIAIPVLT